MERVDASVHCTKLKCLHSAQGLGGCVAGQVQLDPWVMDAEARLVQLKKKREELKKHRFISFEGIQVRNPPANACPMQQQDQMDR
jgi:hypothetical protein